MSDTFSKDLRSGASPAELVIAQGNIVLLLMGEPFNGKTYFLAGWPKRLLVQQTDPPDKAKSYERAGYLPSPVQHGKYCDFQDFYSPKNLDTWCTRVEFFGEENPYKATAKERFENRMRDVAKDIVEWGIRTIGYDGITSGGEAARIYNECRNHPADNRLNYGAESYFLDRAVKLLYPGLCNYCNVVVLAHIMEKFVKEGEKDERTPRQLPSGPGNFSKSVGGKYAEMWRIYQNDKGQYILQTQKRPGVSYGCESLRSIPDYTLAHYKAVEAFLIEEKRRQEAVVKKEGA